MAALLVHTAAALALPDAPSHVTAPAPTVWLSVLPAAGELEAPVFAPEASAPSPARVVRQRTARTRAPASAQRAPAAVVASAQPGAAGELPPGTTLDGQGANTSPDTGDLGSTGDAGQEGHAGLAGSGHAGTGHGPGLLTARNPCGGYFPASARANHGQVRVQVQVDEAGHVRVARVLMELPNGQEFGAAARACASALRFAPAVDGLGLPVAGDAKLELSFHRS